MKKQFFVAAMALTLGVGLTACSSDDLNVKDSKEQSQKASTFMTVSFELPTAGATRAADDKQDDTDPAFNNVGKWAGQDKVKKVAVYVFNNADNLEVTREYDETELSFTQNDGSNKAVVSANKAFKVEAGQKKVYVVVNPSAAATTLLSGKTTLTAFETAYQSSDLAFTSTSVATAHSATLKTVADELAEVEGSGTASRDVILMTGAGVSQNIDDNVSAQQAVSGLKNRVKLEVQRAAARVVVTTTATSFNVEGIDPTSGATITDAAKVEDLTYVVAQGENKLFFLQKKQNPAGTDGAAFNTPAFDKVPSNDDYWTNEFQYSYQGVGKHYDYSGLWKSTTSYTTVKGITVPSRAGYSSTPATELGQVTADLAAGLKGEFVLPTLHKYVDRSDNDARKKTGYRKGNTAYILVRGHIVPKNYVDNAGAVQPGTSLAANADLFLGANGVFYADAATARDAGKKGVAGQSVQLYKGGKVLYFLWLNPDITSTDNKAINSPVIRNNIYHVQIKGIAKIGANWNPLVPPGPGVTIPTTPGTIDPNDPTNPVNNNPNNPDPRPIPNENPYEPTDPPVDPKDPLTLKETWMSVNVSILPWAVHSYEVELSI